MKFIGIIPSRWASSRFPGKPLADICGMTMIERVYRQASLALDDVVVATDDKRIYDEVTRFGGHAVMTSSQARSGTARVNEAYRVLGSDADVVVNIQGDEPFIDPRHIRLLMDEFADPEVCVATVARRFDPAEGWEALFSPDSPKVVMDNRHDAMYFSRSIIPYVRGHQWQDWIHSTDFYIHVGLYAYRAATLAQIVNLPIAEIEAAERLEQLDWMYAGIKVRVAPVSGRTISVDTPADLRQAIEYCMNK